MNEAHLIVGLGNPGAKYDHTRHNIGFRVLEELASVWGGTWSDEKKFKARMSRATVEGRTLHLCQPQTFMNLSGEAVGAVSDYYKITPARVLVIVDDTEQPFGQIRLRAGGGNGGHNGLGSVQKHLATPDYPRLRIGVGRPSSGRDMSAHVLGRFAAEEVEHLGLVLQRVRQQIDCWLQQGVAKAMNEFNGKLDFPHETTEKEIT